MADIHDDEGNPLKPITDHLLEDTITFSLDPKRAVIKKTLNAYQQATLAMATAIPLTLGGPPTIVQQEAARKPEEHLPSQSSAVPTAEPMRSLMVAASTASSVMLTGGEMVAGQGNVFVVRSFMLENQSLPDKDKPQ